MSRRPGFPVLTRMDDEIDALEVAVLVGPTSGQLQRLSR
jgi:hypothetical protein